MPHVFKRHNDHDWNDATNECNRCGMSMYYVYDGWGIAECLEKIEVEFGKDVGEILKKAFK